MLTLLIVAMSIAVALLASVLWHVADAATASADLAVTARTPGLIESDWTTVYYPPGGNSSAGPLLVSNDGATATGGFHVWDLAGSSNGSLTERSGKWTGRTKLVTTVYDIDGRDYLISIPQTTSTLTAYELPGAQHTEELSQRTILGDWSALCSWRSPSGNNYVYLFGKTEGVQFLVRPNDGSVETVEVCLQQVPRSPH